MTVAGTPSGAHASQSGSRLAPGFMLGEYRLGQPLWPLRIADAYKADGPKGPATVYVIKAAVAANPAVRDQIIAGTRTAAALPEHKHLVKTLAAGLTGDILWIATEEVDGQLVRDLLAKKRLASQAGLGVRAAGNLIAGVCAALSEATHGALADESVVVNRTGRVRVIDLALGAGTAAAMVANLVPASSAIAPETLTGAAPNGASDVYGIGALLYEVLVGKPLERGGPRPSDVVKEATKEIDELVARCCHRDPQKRFGRPEVLGAIVGDTLGGGGKSSPTIPPPLADVPAPATAVEAPSLASSLTNAPAVSGNAVIDRALAAALADSTEKWLVTKGKLDYGPFSLADVVTQIEKGDIVHGNIIMDKDTGARVDVGDHPLLGPMVDVARQKRDDARRAQAEVKVQSQHKKRGFLLYGVIILGVAGLGGGGYLVYQSSKKAEKGEETSVVAAEGASLKVDLSQPKAPPPVKRKPGAGRRTGTGGSYAGNASDDLALDMSDESEDGGGTETLPMGEVFAGYSKKAGPLGSCLGNGTSSVSIYISIDGKSGRVNVVKVNGGASGGLWACVNGVMRSIQFRQTSGGRTRAEFDINI